jgi:hypothetical protein
MFPFCIWNKKKLVVIIPYDIPVPFFSLFFVNEIKIEDLCGWGYPCRMPGKLGLRKVSIKIVAITFMPISITVVWITSFLAYYLAVPSLYWRTKKDEWYKFFYSNSNSNSNSLFSLQPYIEAIFIASIVT